AAGIEHIGENYLQEALSKMAELQDLPLLWHFIGPIQSNKPRAIAEHSDWVHSVDRLKLAPRLPAQLHGRLPPLHRCLQVNSSGGAGRSGVAPAELPALASGVAALPGLRLRGRVAVPAPAGDRAAPRGPRRALREAMAALELP